MAEALVRNIAVLGHLGSGKTSLVEALYSTATNKEKGSVERRNTVSDYLAEEQQRASSVVNSIIPVEYKNYRLNLMDLPGNDDFIGEVISAIKVCKGAILVVDASCGVEVGTIKHWNMLRKKNIPTIIYVNKMDKINKNFDLILEEIRSKLGKNAIPFSYPMGHLDKFDGFVNIVTLKARKYNGKECVDDEIYPQKRQKVFELHNMIVESVAQTSDELLDKFFNGEALTNEEINKGLRNGVLNGELIPVIVGSATKNIGIHTMLDMFINYLPNPQDLQPIIGLDESGNEVAYKTISTEPFSAFVFKTNYDPYTGISNIIKVNSGSLSVGDDVYISDLNRVERITNLSRVFAGKLIPTTKLYAGEIGAITKIDGLETQMSLSDPIHKVTFKKIEFPTPVYFKSIVSSNKNDDDKLSVVLNKLCLADKTITVKRNQETKQLLLGTLSLGHLATILDRIKNVYKLNLKTEDEKIVYRETITTSAIGNGRYIKQSGGSGFYGVVEMEFKPNKENLFTEEIFGGAVPKNYFPAVEKGFYEALEKGLLAGYPVVGVHAILRDGKYHAVDSNEVSFKNAAILAFKDAYMRCNPVLLEPIYEIVITVDQTMVGAIISDLNTRRAKISNVEINSYGAQKITALVPQIEILDYANVLKSLTQGSGFFNRSFYDYEVAPSQVAKNVVK